MENKIGIIILAAGNSSRLGQAKQLLNYNGKTLIRHVVDEATLVNTAKVIVVTGAANEALEHELKLCDATFVRNEQWSEGMGASIKKGLKELLILCPHLSAVIITVCDQPFVSAKLFKSLIAVYQESGKLIVASAYSETIGTPALYDSAYFTDLLELSGSKGAKKIIQDYKSTVISIPFEKGEIDIDTLEDYYKLTR